MEMKLTKQEKSALPRQDIEAHVAFDQTTPSRHSVKQSLAKRLKAEEKLVIIRHIYNNFGTKESRILAYLYENEDALRGIEYPKMIEKNGNKAAAPKEGEAPKQESGSEA